MIPHCAHCLNFTVWHFVVQRRVPTHVAISVPDLFQFCLNKVWHWNVAINPASWLFFLFILDLIVTLRRICRGNRCAKIVAFSLLFASLHALTKMCFDSTSIALCALVAFPAILVPPPSCASPSPLSSPPGPHNPQVTRQEAHQTMLHQRPETQTGEVQTLLGVLQEGVWQLPFLSGHEEVWWARAHEEGLHLETVFSGEASIVLFLLGLRLSVLTAQSYSKGFSWMYFHGLWNSLHSFVHPACPAEHSKVRHM